MHWNYQKRTVRTADKQPTGQPAANADLQRRQKLLGALGLARRAGALVPGFDAVCEQAAKGNAALVLLAQDLSPGTLRRVQNACKGCCLVLGIPLTQADIASITKKPVGVLAVTDPNLAILCQKHL